MLELKPEVMPEHPCYLDSYLIRRKVKGIIFKVTKDTFTKCYETPDYISIEEQRIRYLNELTVYKYFKKIDWKWSPRLLDYSENSITIERKKYKTIDEHLHCNSLFNIDN